MYAAAGGASIASRQARQKQKQKKAAALQKATGSGSGKSGTPGSKCVQSASKVNLSSGTPQSKQFHNLPSNYYNQNQQFGINKPKSSPAERSSLTTGLKPPGAVSRRNSSNVHHHSHLLKPSETVAGHLSKAKSTTKIHHSQSCVFATKDILPNHPFSPTDQHTSSTSHHHTHHSHIHHKFLIPEPPERSDSIIDPNAIAKSSLVLPLNGADVSDDVGGKPLERRCSVRHRDATQHEFDDNHLSYDNQNQLNHQMGYNEDRPRWDIMGYNDDSHDKYDCGSLDFPFSECSQGRAAWQERERERRGSLTEAALSHRARQTEAHLRWMKRNRIHDASYGGSSDEEDILGGLYGNQSAAANALLYVGLGTVAIGAVIFFVGTGEKGFKTLELRLIGPTLVGCGFLCCLVRILLCVCPSRCFRRKKRKRCRHIGGSGSSRRFRNSNQMPNEDFRMADHNTSLLRKQQQTNKKRVSIATGLNNSRPIASTSQNIATTSLFLQNEQQTNVVPTKSKIPTIEVPHLIEVSEISDLNKQTNQTNNININNNSSLPKADSIIELQNLEMYDDVSSVSASSSDNENDKTIKQNTSTTICKVDVNNPADSDNIITSSISKSKINRKREPLNQQQQSQAAISSITTTTSSATSTSTHTSIMETSLSLTTTTPSSLFHKRNELIINVQPETSGVHRNEINKNPTTMVNKTPTPGEIVLSPSKLGQ